MRAYVFVNVKAGKAKVVVRELTKVDGVQAADACWGVPDIIALVHAKNERALNDIVLNGISKITGVEHTDTHIALD